MNAATSRVGVNVVAIWKFATFHGQHDAAASRRDSGPRNMGQSPVAAMHRLCACVAAAGTAGKLTWPLSCTRKRSVAPPLSLTTNALPTTGCTVTSAAVVRDVAPHSSAPRIQKGAGASDVLRGAVMKWQSVMAVSRSGVRHRVSCKRLDG